MIRGPPSPTLFPSPPPSRSIAGSREHCGDRLGGHERLVGEDHHRAVDVPERRDATVQRRRHALGPGVAHDHPRVDRKSTRLNSSHANISYAVFCLKKNNLSYLPLLELTPYLHHPHSTLGEFLRHGNDCYLVHSLTYF